MAEIKKTEEYLEREFGIRNIEELEAASQRVSDIDIGLFVTPIFREEKRSMA